MPPILFASLQAPFTKLAHTLFPPAMANGIISGAFMFCKCSNHELANIYSWFNDRCFVRLHALCVSAICRFHLKLTHSHSNLTVCTTPAFLPTSRLWKSTILLIITRISNLGLVLPVCSVQFIYSFPMLIARTGKIWDVVFNTVLPVWICCIVVNTHERFFIPQLVGSYSFVPIFWEACLWCWMSYLRVILIVV